MMTAPRPEGDRAFKKVKHATDDASSRGALKMPDTTKRGKASSPGCLVRAGLLT